MNPILVTAANIHVNLPVRRPAYDDVEFRGEIAKYDSSSFVIMFTDGSISCQSYKDGWQIDQKSIEILSYKSSISTGERVMLVNKQLSYQATCDALEEGTLFTVKSCSAGAITLMETGRIYMISAFCKYPIQKRTQSDGGTIYVGDTVRTKTNPQFKHVVRNIVGDSIYLSGTGVRQRSELILVESAKDSHLRLCVDSNLSAGMAVKLTHPEDDSDSTRRLEKDRVYLVIECIGGCSVMQVGGCPVSLRKTCFSLLPYDHSNNLITNKNLQDVYRNSSNTGNITGTAQKVCGSEIEVRPGKEIRGFTIRTTGCQIKIASLSERNKPGPCRG